MSFEFACHNCGRELKADERSIGRRVRCPQCESLIVIPDPAEMEEEQQELDEAVADNSVETEDRSGQVTAERPVEHPHPSPVPKAEGTAAATFHEAAALEPRADVTPPPVAVSAYARPKPAPEPPLLLPPQAHPEDLIDMTAMVDIVFFLLIFFMVTSLQSLEAVMNLPTPQSAEGGVSTSRSVTDLENDPNYITVRIEDDDSIWVEDTQVFNDQELARRLRSARKESDGPRSLLVIGDADASHGSAVRVFDAGAGAGVNSISLIVQEKSESSR